MLGEETPGAHHDRYLLHGVCNDSSIYSETLFLDMLALGPTTIVRDRTALQELHASVEQVTN